MGRHHLFVLLMLTHQQRSFADKSPSKAARNKGFEFQLIDAQNIPIFYLEYFMKCFSVVGCSSRQTHRGIALSGWCHLWGIGVGLLLSSSVMAEDQRQLVTLPPPAQEVLRLEMLDNLVSINEILTLVAADKFKDAGELAEQKLGLSAQGKHRGKPFDARPGPHMPPAMHALAMDGHRAASEFAKAAQTGDRARTLALLPNLTSACVACHFSYRTR